MEGLQYASQLPKGRTIKQTVCRRASSNRAIIIFASSVLSFGSVLTRI